MSMENLRVILVDPNPALCAAWQREFKGDESVEIVNGYFEDLPEFDCMVSAANSFGIMDGGVDAAIIRFFGAELMRRVQQRILEEYLGEQPVGTSFIVETDHPRHPFVAHTPTMRVPMSIARTDYVYNAMRAMLLAVRAHNRDHPDRSFRVIACPGLGTATGMMAFSEAARQMALAWRSILHPPDSIDWDFASARQASVRRGGDMGCRPAQSGLG
jgi:O-acetyl-ADP-ribose deacetylase (regulator of RNase III)